LRLLYRDDWVELYHGDAREVDRVVKDAQLCVTSPPYNVGVNYGGMMRDHLPWPEYYAFLEEALTSIYQALRPGGVLALVIPHHVSDRSNGWKRPEPVYLRVWELVEKTGFLIRQPIVWAKGWPHQGVLISPNNAVGSPANPNFRFIHEMILLASKEHLHRLNTGPGGGKRHQPFEYMDWLKDVWVIPTVGGRGGRKPEHPATFPPEIPARLILLFTEPGELVLDPFGGSMTTCLVAKRLGRRAIGVDIVEDYVVAAAGKMRQMVLPLEIAETRIRQSKFQVAQ